MNKFIDFEFSFLVKTDIYVFQKMYILLNMSLLCYTLNFKKWYIHMFVSYWHIRVSQALLLTLNFVCLQGYVVSYSLFRRIILSQYDTFGVEKMSGQADTLVNQHIGLCTKMPQFKEIGYFRWGIPCFLLLLFFGQ